ncbi:endonuclease VII domain-containing protein [Actinomadura sp. NPDC047616]|uniref:endonuclease VII domain-containing protein n=1 Tax=Actinomadura sp. NPDC047616 TaxID=3155914 RepID=UPI0033F825E4
MLTKKCRDCGQVKPVSQFYRRKASPDGLALYCKECFGLRNAASYRKRQAALGKEARPYRRHSAVPEGMKYCPRCEQIKSVEEFGRNRSTKSGLTAYCKRCHNTVMVEGKRRKHGSERNYLLKLRYGITEEEMEQMRAQQGGVCVICLQNAARHVDHDHMTGLVRHLLCFKCNGGIGQFEDDPQWMRDAALYLELGGPHARRMMIELGTKVINRANRHVLNELRRWAKPRPLEEGSTRHHHLRRKYGIDHHDAELLLHLQVGLCAICCDRPAEHVDHDHDTGDVRGMLCTGCNTGMGQLGDDPISLRRAADYVQRRLVQEVPDGEDGGMRLSFTEPDVDPRTVPMDGWGPYRERDGEYRRDAVAVEEEIESMPWAEMFHSSWNADRGTPAG